MIRGRTNRAATVLLAGVLALSIAACGGDDDDSASSDTEAAGSAPVATDAGPAATTPTSDAGDESPATTTGADTGATGDEDARLRFAYTLAAPGGYDPHRSSGAFATISLYPVYDRLVHLNTDASAKPGLATEWAFTDDGLALDMTLREGVVFHDGEPFNAEAVKANLERAKTLDGSTAAADLTRVESVDVIDEYHVRINLSAPMASLPLVLADRSGMMLSPAAFDNEDLLTNPVGAGAFKLTSFDPDASITFDRFEEYWDRENVHLAGIDFTVQTDANARLNALISGELDITYINAEDVAEAEAAGLTVISEPLLSYHTITLDRSEPPFDNLQVRQAMQMSIDRQAIVDAVYGGVGSPSLQLYPDGYFANNPDYGLDAVPFDPERAKELLAEAGYPDGFEFQFTVMNVPYIVAYATAVQDYWAQIGITATMDLIDPAAGAEKCWAQSGCQSFTIRALSADPVTSLTRLYTVGGSHTLGDNEIPEITELIDQIEAETDPEARAALLQEASAFVVENALDIMVYQDASPLAFNDDVLNVPYYTTGWIEFGGVAVQR